MTTNAKILATFFSVFILQMGFAQREPTPGNTVDYNTVNMPETPTAAAFNSVGNTKVNTATGIPSISIPLYTYELDGIKIPISISYNASGVKVSEFSTPVGLNWSLEAGGQISRTVRGMADEEPDAWFDEGFLSDSWYSSYNPNDPYDWQEDMKGLYINDYNGYAKGRDHNPDLFSYSFLGNAGTYIHTTTGDIFKERQNGIQISDFGNSDDSLEADDMNGNHYDFYYSDTEKSSNTNISSSNGDLTEDFFDWEGNTVTAWKLSKITTKNGKVVNFDYQNENMEYTLYGTEFHLTVGYGCAAGGSPPQVKTLSKTNIMYKYNTQLIDKISSPDGNIEIDFNYTSDSGLPATVWKKKLTSIVVRDVITGKVKEYRFTYLRFSGDQRLKLTSVYEVGYDDNNNMVQKPPYVFTYNNYGPLPSKDSYSQDFFGYYNASTGPSSLVPHLDNIGYPFQGYFDSNSRDRSVNPLALKNGILTDITYPTGGSTHFEYVPNAIGDKYCGGLRVSEIKDIDETGTYNRKTYQYENLYGKNMEDNIGLFIKTEGGTHSYNSGFIALPGDATGYRSGYFYGKVTVTSHDGSDNYKEEFAYEENPYALQKFDYALKSTTSFKGGQEVKMIEYINDTIGSPQYYWWNALGEMICYGAAPNPVKLGYSNLPKKVYYDGEYAYMPKRIATTEFLGTSYKPVTIIQDISYDPNTLLKLQEVKDMRQKRLGYNNYQLVDSNGEKTTTVYKYPKVPTDEGFSNDFPQAQVIRQEVFSTHSSGQKISGQAFEFDGSGNIKKAYEYNKGEIGNNNPLAYIPDDYEEMATLIYANGKPVQVHKKNGAAISYIWGYKEQYPVAKIEGVTYTTLLNSGHVAAIQSASNTTPYNENNLLTALNNLRNAYPNAMISTFTHIPLKGVKTIIDAKGDKMTYYYDGVGRLEYVKDKDGNRLSENKYNYGN